MYMWDIYHYHLYQLCAPNYGYKAEGSGGCNPLNIHFVHPIEAFEKIAIWKASNMPVQYWRYI